MKFYIISLILTIIFSVSLFGQNNNINQLEIRNLLKTDAKTYEFDIYIKVMKPIDISAYQLIFSYNEKILSGDFTFEYVINSSQMKNKPIICQTITLNSGEKLLALASGPGSEEVNKEIKIGKFKIKSKNEFLNEEKIDLQWNFNTNIYTIIMDTNGRNITDKFNFKIN